MYVAEYILYVIQCEHFQATQNTDCSFVCLTLVTAELGISNHTQETGSVI